MLAPHRFTARLIAVVVLIGCLEPPFARAQVDAPIPVESVQLRSGSLPGNARDPNVLCWKVPSSGFVLPVSASEFASARAGFAAFVLSKYPSSYVSRLAADTAAKWINETGASASGNSVLYAIPFTLDQSFETATLEVDFAVDNTLGFSPNPGIYLNEQGLAGSLGGTHETASHFFFPSVQAQLHPGPNVLYLLAHDTGLDGAILFSIHVRTYRSVPPPVLAARVIGPPVVRNERTATYTLELTNSSADTIGAAVVCVYASDTSTTMVADFPIPDPIQPPDTVLTATRSGQVIDGQLAFSFVAMHLPPNTTDRSRTLSITFHLGARAHANCTITAIAVPLDGSDVPPELGLSTSSAQSARYPYPVPCVARLLKNWTTLWWADFSQVVVCGAQATLQGIEELMNPAAPPFFNRPIEDLARPTAEAGVRCGLNATIKTLIRRGPGTLAKTVSALGIACNAAEVLHECVDSRIQTCGQIWDQAMSVFVGRSIDPNAIVGPVDELGGPAVNPDWKLSFTTEFENKASATLPAQMIGVFHHMTPGGADPASLRIEQLVLGSRTFDLRGIDLSSAATFDLRPNVNLLLKVSASTSVGAGGDFSVMLYGVDPVTGMIPVDARGILPPNVAPPAGEGAIVWSVRAAPGHAERDSIVASAQIQFDSEPVLATNLWENTFDVTPPDPELIQVLPGADGLSSRILVGGSDALAGVVWRGLEAVDDFGNVVVLDADAAGLVLHRAGGPGNVHFIPVCRDAVGHIAAGNVANQVAILLPWPAGTTSAPGHAPPAFRAFPTPVRDGVLRFIVPTAGTRVELHLYDVMGREAAAYRNEHVDASTSPLEWKLTTARGNPPAGVYYLRGRVGDRPVSQKVVLVH